MSIHKVALLPTDTLFHSPKVNGIMSLVLHKIFHPPCCVSDDWRKLKIAYGVGMASSGIRFLKVVRCFKNWSRWPERAVIQAQSGRMLIS